MSACEVLMEKSKPRKAKKEPTLILRSVLEGGIQKNTEDTLSSHKRIASVTLNTDGLSNRFALKNNPLGTATSIKSLVHHNPYDNEKRETATDSKDVTELGNKISIHEFDPSPKTDEYILQAAESEEDYESVDSHGNRINAYKFTNYIEQEKKTEEGKIISQTDNDLRNYVLTEQAKGFQCKNSLKRPHYASLVYGHNEVEGGESSDEPKMHFLKAPDHEGSLSGIDNSEVEIDRNHEEDEAFSSLGCHEDQHSLVMSETTRKKDQTAHKNLVDALLSEKVETRSIHHTGSKEDEAAAFLADAPQNVRKMIADYLISKKLSYVLVSPSNFHYSFHASTVLELKQLTGHCYEFLDENPEFDQKSLVLNCELCLGLIANRNSERSKVLKVTASRKSNPHFCVAFSRQEARRTNIYVIDINTGVEIYTRETKRPFLCERGFICCCVNYRECPYVFVSGGKHKLSRQMWRYDVIVSKWQRVSSMIHGRSYHSMVALNDGTLYAIGGEEVNCTEKYSLDDKKWRECSKLNFPVVSGTCVRYEKKIYIFSGDTSVGRVQCFTPAFDKIETLHPLPCPVVEAHAVVFQDKIYIVSGDGQVICFEPVTGMSYMGASQPVIRSKFCLFTCYDKIYITGGRLKEESCDQKSEYNYRFNMSTNAWTRTRKLQGRFLVRTFCDMQMPQRCPVVPFDKMKF